MWQFLPEEDALDLSAQGLPALRRGAAVDGFVGHAHALVVGILRLQPPGNLFGRPVQHQFTRNHVAQLAVHGKQTAFRSQRCVPCLLVRIIGAIARSATVARDLPAHRRRSPTKTIGNLSQRRAGSHASAGGPGIDVRPALWVLGKIEKARRVPQRSDFQNLGLGVIFPCSVAYAVLPSRSLPAGLRRIHN